MKLATVRMSAARARGFDSTYEGLKPAFRVDAFAKTESFDSTYEGLKRAPRARLCPAPWGFDSTYEGLKLESQSGARADA